VNEILELASVDSCNVAVEGPVAAQVGRMGGSTQGSTQRKSPQRESDREDERYQIASRWSMVDD
jgi:hypothetical protein